MFNDDDDDDEEEGRPFRTSTIAGSVNDCLIVPLQSKRTNNN